MSPQFVLGRENVPYVADGVDRSLKADFVQTLTIVFFLNLNPVWEFD